MIINFDKSARKKPKKKPKRRVAGGIEEEEEVIEETRLEGQQVDLRAEGVVAPELTKEEKPEKPERVGARREEALLKRKTKTEERVEFLAEEEIPTRIAEAVPVPEEGTEVPEVPETAKGTSNTLSIPSSFWNSTIES